MVVASCAIPSAFPQKQVMILGSIVVCLPLGATLALIGFVPKNDGKSLCWRSWVQSIPHVPPRVPKYSHVEHKGIGEPRGD